MRRLVTVLLAVGMLAALAGPAMAAETADDETPTVATNGASEGLWSNNRWWRVVAAPNKTCKLGFNPKVRTTVARSAASGKAVYTDVDHSLLQVDFAKRNGDEVFKEKEVGWFPSQIGEYKFKIDPAEPKNVFRNLRFRHRYTGDVPFNNMVMEGPNGGSILRVWAAVSFNWSVTDPMFVPLRFKTAWWCEEQ